MEKIAPIEQNFSFKSRLYLKRLPYPGKQRESHKIGSFFIKKKTMTEEGRFSHIRMIFLVDIYVSLFFKTCLLQQSVRSGYALADTAIDHLIT